MWSLNFSNARLDSLSYLAPLAGGLSGQNEQVGGQQGQPPAE